MDKTFEQFLRAVPRIPIFTPLTGARQFAKSRLVYHRALDFADNDWKIVERKMRALNSICNPAFHFPDINHPVRWLSVLAFSFPVARVMQARL
jgi:hypothetical protein